jgi:hypothetical protein
MVHTINPSVDLSQHDDVTISELWHSDLGNTLTQTMHDGLEALIASGATSWEAMRIVLDRTTRTVTMDRQYTTLEQANDRLAWLEANIPGTTTNFTRTNLSSIDNTSITEPGAFVI